MTLDDRVNDAVQELRHGQEFLPEFSKHGFNDARKWRVSSWEATPGEFNCTCVRGGTDPDQVTDWHEVGKPKQSVSLTYRRHKDGWRLEHCNRSWAYP